MLVTSGSELTIKIGVGKMSGDRKKLIAFNYFGSKFTIADKLEPFFPDHIHWVDVFMGSMAVTLNKRPSKIETVNDLNGDIVNFFRVLRNEPDKLYTQIYMTPVSRQEFNESWVMEGCSDLERARRFYVRSRQSFNSMGAQAKNKGWHMAKTSSRSNMSEVVSKWRNGIEKLGPVIDRILTIQIENKHFRDLIPAIDFPGALFYCDPPYIPESRASKNDYKHEMTINEHTELAAMLHGIKGKCMISGYDGKQSDETDSNLMGKLYRDFRKFEFPVKFNNIRNGAVKECIWMNY